MRVTTRRVLIVANPKARGHAPRKLAAIRDALARDGVAVDLMQSQARGDIERIVADIGAGFDVIAVHGGDGTINEAIAGLRTISGAQPALAIIAGGTANVLASETRAARDADAIAATIRDGRTALVRLPLVLDRLRLGVAQLDELGDLGALLGRGIDARRT